jgi:phosphoribosylformylglycinamidine cyclo-ligase
MKRMTYARSGVDIDAKSDAIRALSGQLKFRRKRFGNVLEGHYTSLIDFGDVYLTLCTDSVGTKLLVADALKRWDTIGIDCIAMNVNDAICVGSEPISFVDYIAIDRPDPKIATEIGKGLNAGAEMANVEIVGGETCVIPEIINGIDLVGTALGYVEKKNIITGENIKEGDAIVAIASSGIHSNGLTLARRVVKDHGAALTDEVEFCGERFVIGEELLTPTTIYVREVLRLCREFDVKGLANITGGGLRNLLRLNPNVKFRITDLPNPLRIFKLIQKWGNVETAEMYQTFNMGMGMVLVVPKKECDDVLQAIGRKRFGWQIGRVVKGRGVEVPKLKLNYARY